MANENRKLATIQTISSIESIPDADKIEVATILGWKIVIKKGEFNVGDKVVYFEVDSFLPCRDEFEFLRPHCYKKNELVGEGFLIRTVKLRGQISQGLVLPLALFRELESIDLVEGLDVTKLLGARVFEQPEGNSYLGTTIGNFHHTVSKTDETRIQSIPYVLDALRGKPYYITEKIDGTSTTIVVQDGNIEIYSARNRIDTNGSMFVKYLQEHGIWEKLLHIPSLAIQGEYYGEGIQKNKLGIRGKEFRFFNLVDPHTNTYYSYSSWAQILEDTGLQGVLKPVKVLEEGNSFDYSLPELLELAKGTYETSGKQREGIVVRPQEEMTVSGHRLSFKVLNNDFLLKYERE